MTSLKPAALLCGYGVLLLSITAFTLPDQPTVFLPGTQPNVVQTFEAYTACAVCHQNTGTTRPVRIVGDWRGSTMGHSARDPVTYSAIAIANKFEAGVGELCIRCHSPTGWLEGRSTDGTGQLLTGNDLNGVSCDFCHRAKDPLIPDSTANPPVPGYGNAMFVVQVPQYPKRGPFTDAMSPHLWVADSFQRSSRFCGVCHDVSNPAQAMDPVTQPPHEYGVEQRTYSEWKLSWYATQGESGTCQSCHMPKYTGYGASLPMAPLRPDIPEHSFAGANSFTQDILPDFWSGLDTAALNLGKNRSVQSLQSAANLEAAAYRLGDSVTALVRVTNLTGHKLPTGYPEGRRMWLNLIGTNANGDTLFQSGAYDITSADLTTDAQLKLYQIRFGLTAATAATYSLLPGPSFYLSLNDTIFIDNRIPPRGFNNAAFLSHMAQPVAYSYADGEYWDLTSYKMPTAVTQVKANLLYQTTSKEYITFLRDENIGNTFDWNDWGDSLYTAWNRQGKSPPVVMNTISVAVTDSTTGLGDPVENLPVAVTLKQNYPNPFNPTTTIEFTVDKTAYVTLVLYDVLGREVRTIIKGRVVADTYRVPLDASGLTSGIYFYRLTANSEFQETKKMALMR